MDRHRSDPGSIARQRVVEAAYGKDDTVNQGYFERLLRLNIFCINCGTADSKIIFRAGHESVYFIY